MWVDEIVEEIRRIREEYAKSFDYDLDAIFLDLRQKEAKRGREIVSLSRKPGLSARWQGQRTPVSENTEDISRRSS